jgi:hypothetical protein
MKYFYVSRQQAKVPQHSIREYQDGRKRKKQIKNRNKISNYNTRNTKNVFCCHRKKKEYRFIPTKQNDEISKKTT